MGLEGPCSRESALSVFQEVMGHSRGQFVTKGVLGPIWSLWKQSWQSSSARGVKTTVKTYRNKAIGCCRTVVIGKNACISPWVYSCCSSLVSAVLSVRKHLFPAHI